MIPEAVHDAMGSEVPWKLQVQVEGEAPATAVPVQLTHLVGKKSADGRNHLQPPLAKGGKQVVTAAAKSALVGTLVEGELVHFLRTNICPGCAPSLHNIARKHNLSCLYHGMFLSMTTGSNTYEQVDLALPAAICLQQVTVMELAHSILLHLLPTDRLSPHPCCSSSFLQENTT
jgi:hypothetical protein